MSLRIYVQGLIEPIESDEPMQATMMNMSAALNQNMHFFITKNMDGEPEAIRIDKVLRITEAD